MTVTPVRAGVLPALIMLCLLLVLQACSTAVPTSRDLNDEDYVQNFRTVAFYREFDPEQIEQVLTRWEEPLRVAVVGDVNERHIEYMRLHLADLAALSGLEVALSDRDTANVIVILSPDPFERALDTYRADYRGFFASDPSMEAVTARMKKEATCFARIVPGDSDDVIVGAVALIPTDQGRFVTRACIIEELTQAMGLFNDSDAIRPSIFNDSSPNMILSDHDRILLRTLYDPRLQPGMTWNQAEPIVRTVIAELRHPG
jgi:hypothetical protein